MQAHVLESKGNLADARQVKSEDGLIHMMQVGVVKQRQAFHVERVRSWGSKP